MFCVSVLISSAEWQRFEQTAQVISQGEKLSRSEIIRRHALAGIKPLREGSLADQARMTHEFQAQWQRRMSGCGPEIRYCIVGAGRPVYGGRASLFCLEPNPGLGQSGPLTNIVIGLLSRVLCVTSRFADPAGIPAPALFGRELCPSTELTYPHQ